jgi:hypothetical protein
VSAQRATPGYHLPPFQVKLKKTELEERYKNLSKMSIDVRDGVEGHADFGNDHPLYDAMGFVRFSDRKSGLTQKKSGPPATT